MDNGESIATKATVQARILNAMGDLVSTQQAEPVAGIAKLSLASIRPGIYMVDAGDGKLQKVVVK